MDQQGISHRAPPVSKLCLPSRPVRRSRLVVAVRASVASVVPHRGLYKDFEFSLLYIEGLVSRSIEYSDVNCCHRSRVAILHVKAPSYRPPFA
jgi:hypothetical protein